MDGKISRIDRKKKELVCAINYHMENGRGNKAESLTTMLEILTDDRDELYTRVRVVLNDVRSRVNCVPGPGPVRFSPVIVPCAVCCVASVTL